MMTQDEVLRRIPAEKRLLQAMLLSDLTYELSLAGKKRKTIKRRKHAAITWVKELNLEDLWKQAQEMDY